MKKIQLTDIIEVEKAGKYVYRTLYRVSLGNGVRPLFTNKNDALSFIAQTNRFLNYKLHECNLLFIKVYTAYRSNWFYFYHNKSVNNNHLARMEKKVIVSLKSIENSFESLYRRTGGTNGNYFAFTFFDNIINNSLSAINIIQQLLRDKKHYKDFQSLEVLKQQTKQIKHTIAVYGHEASNEFKESIDYDHLPGDD
jgi:hypothetical protein